MWKVVLKLFGVNEDQFEKLRNLAYAIATICGLLLTVVNPVFALPALVIKVVTVIGALFAGVGITSGNVKKQIEDPKSSLTQSK